MTDPTSRFVNANGTTFHYLDWGGSGQPCLMVHGTGLCAGVWEPIADVLRERFHCMALDLRGHGESGGADADISWDLVARDVAGVIDALDLQGALIVGHSRGASAVLLSTLYSASHFAATVLVEPTILMRFGQPEDPPFSNSRLVGATMKKKSVFASRSQMKAELLERRSFQAWNPAVLDAYCRYGAEELADGSVRLRCEPATELKFYQAPVDVSVWDCVERMQFPVRLLVSEKQELFNLNAAGIQRFMSEVGAGTGLLPGDHFTAQQFPRELAEAVLGFASSL